LLELPHCNADTFQIFLNELANNCPKEFKIVILDNGAFHHAKRLCVYSDDVDHHSGDVDHP